MPRGFTLQPTLPPELHQQGTRVLYHYYAAPTYYTGAPKQYSAPSYYSTKASEYYTKTYAPPTYYKQASKY
jgi:hypothetical protein